MFTIYNYGQNIYRLFHFLEQFVFFGGAYVPSQEKKRLRILGNYYILRKLLKYLGLMASTQSSTQKPNVDVFWQKTAEISCKAFHRETYFA